MRSKRGSSFDSSPARTPECPCRQGERLCYNSFHVELVGQQKFSQAFRVFGESVMTAHRAEAGGLRKTSSGARSPDQHYARTTPAASASTNTSREYGFATMLFGKHRTEGVKLRPDRRGRRRAPGADTRGRASRPRRPDSSRRRTHAPSARTIIRSPPAAGRRCWWHRCPPRAGRRARRSPAPPKCGRRARRARTRGVPAAPPRGRKPVRLGGDVPSIAQRV